MTEKGKFLRKFNEAFAEGNIEFLLESVTDDITWVVHGDFSLEGKENYKAAVMEMQSPEPFELTIDHIITHGKSAALDGVMKSPDGQKFAFCDVYEFSGFKNPKIKKMTSYVIEVKN